MLTIANFFGSREEQDAYISKQPAPAVFGVNQNIKKLLVFIIITTGKRQEKKLVARLSQLSSEALPVIVSAESDDPSAVDYQGE